MAVSEMRRLACICTVVKSNVWKRVSDFVHIIIQFVVTPGPSSEDVNRNAAGSTSAVFLEMPVEPAYLV